MQLKDILNTVYYWKNRHDPECANALSTLVWWCLLFLTLLFLTGAILYSIWMLSGSRSMIEAEETVGQSETLSRESLKNTLELFEQRKKRFQFVGSNPPRIPDPSR